MDWTRLPFSRASVDRCAERRTDPELIAAAWRAQGTQVVVVAAGLLAVLVPAGVDPAPADPDPVDPAPADPGSATTSEPATASGRVTLDLIDPGDLAGAVSGIAPSGQQLPPAGDSSGPPAGVSLLAFLGHDGVDVLALIVPDASLVPGDRVWRSLRDIAHLLDDRQTGLASTAVALAAWHERHPRCPLCGAPTVPTLAGWTRTCVEDGSEHYPRTDPAVIMAVVDDDDRLLLAHPPHWTGRRFSTLAGFVEPGESAEAAVAREVAEEVGIGIGEVTYRGSQSWPFPGSLMLAYRARAVSTEIAVDGVEIAEASWFTRAELTAALTAGALTLPTRASIARALIEEWFGGPLENAGSGPRA